MKQGWRRRIHGDLNVGKGIESIYLVKTKQLRPADFAKITGWKIIYPLFWTRRDQIAGLIDLFLPLHRPKFWH